MGRALLEAANPPMWWIDGGSDGRPARFVRFGGQQIALADVIAMSLEEVRDHRASGLLFSGILFVVCSCMLAFYVYEGGGRERFLIGAVFLGFLGVGSLIEAAVIRHTRHFELTFTLKDGRRVAFASADRADTQALALRLASEGVTRI